MDRELFDIAHSLQTKLNNISPESDWASLIWAHGFLTGMLQDLAARVPESAVQRKPTSIEKASKLLEDAQRILDGLEQRSLKRAARDQSHPSLEELINRLRDKSDYTNPSEIAGVPAKIKPGPKGLRGGVALPLPTDTDYKM